MFQMAMTIWTSSQTDEFFWFTYMFKYCEQIKCIRFTFDFSYVAKTCNMITCPISSWVEASPLTILSLMCFCLTSCSCFICSYLYMGHTTPNKQRKTLTILRRITRRILHILIRYRFVYPTTHWNRDRH